MFIMRQLTKHLWLVRKQNQPSTVCSRWITSNSNNGSNKISSTRGKKNKARQHNIEFSSFPKPLNSEHQDHKSYELNQTNQRLITRDPVKITQKTIQILHINAPEERGNREKMSYPHFLIAEESIEQFTKSLTHRSESKNLSEISFFFCSLSSYREKEIAEKIRRRRSIWRRNFREIEANKRAFGPNDFGKKSSTEYSYSILIFHIFYFRHALI